MSSGPWASLCSACVLELAAPCQCGEEDVGPLRALGVFSETPGPAVLAGGKRPMWRRDSRRGATSPHKESREAERSPSEAPREVGLLQLLPARIPELPPGLRGDLGAELHVQLLAGFRLPHGGACGGERVAQVSSRGWRSESARALVLRGKRRVEDGYTTEDLKAQRPHDEETHKPSKKAEGESPSIAPKACEGVL